MVSQELSYGRFRALHERPGAFVMPNAWDGASALLLHRAGFAALGSSSFAIASSLGRHDGRRAVSREAAIANAQLLVRLSTLASLGVRRISLGGALYRRTMASLVEAAAALQLGDIPSAIRGAVPASEIDDLIPKGVAEAN